MNWFLALLHNLTFVSGVWLMVFFVAETLVPILALRYFRQKIPFQVAWSAEFGGLLQVAYYVIAISVIHRTTAFPFWMGARLQVLALVAGVVVGGVWTCLDWKTEWADLFHHAWVVWQQVFLFVFSTVVIAWGRNTAEILSAIAFLGLLGVLFWVDGKLGTLAQIIWIYKRTGLWLGDRQKDPPKI